MALNALRDLFTGPPPAPSEAQPLKSVDDQ